MNKSGLLIVLLVVLPIVYADQVSTFDEDKAYQWLYDQMSAVDWDRPANEIALALLSLSTKPEYDLSAGVNQLISLEQDYWWGDPTKSALATYALYVSTTNVSDEIQKLKDSQIVALTGGDWLIQLRSSGENIAECSINYGDTEHILRVLNNTIVSEECDTGQRWMNFEYCIHSPLSVHEEFTMDCRNGYDSLLFWYSGDYYLIKEGSPYSIDIGCFPVSSICSCDDSTYASWILSRMNEDTYSLPYMRINCIDDLHSAFLFMLTSDEMYADFLEENFDGTSWGDDETTAYAIRALRRASGYRDTADDALTSLKIRQRQDGSWNGNILDTATILFAVFTDTPSHIPGGGDYIPGSSECGNNIVESPDEDCDNSTCPTGKVCQSCQCVADTACDKDLGDECEKDTHCPRGEYCSSGCDCVSDAECSDDDDCPIFGYICVGGECVPEGGPSVDDDVGDEGGDSFWNWFFVVLGILVVLGGAYFAYHKFLKGRLGKKPAKPAYPVQSRRYPVAKQAVTKPVVSRPVKERASAYESEIEKKLDASLKRARELLGKKK